MRGYWRSTFLMGGEGDSRSKWASTADAFDVQNGRIASLSAWGLSRLNTDGSCGPYSIYGPRPALPLEAQSIALSPDGKWLYITGCYTCATRSKMGTHLARMKWDHGVYRIAFNEDKPPTLWKGGKKKGNDENHFNHPSDVLVDSHGRVYIADNFNDRVQIFSVDGKLLKSIPVNGPAQLGINPKTGELYVFSWTMAMYGYDPPRKVKAMLRVFSPFKDGKPSGNWPLPLKGYKGQSRGIVGSTHYDECPLRAAIDTFAEKPTVWLATNCGSENPGTYQNANINYSLSRYTIEGDKLVEKSFWNHEVKEAIAWWAPTNLMRKRLYVDHGQGTLYIAEADSKAQHLLTRIDPETGKTRIIEFPYTFEECVIDTTGHIFLRVANIIGRHDLKTLREVPFDYGEERSVRWSSSAKTGRLQAVSQLKVG